MKYELSLTQIQELQDKINKLTRSYVLTDNKNIMNMMPENASPYHKHLTKVITMQESASPYEKHPTKVKNYSLNQGINASLIPIRGWKYYLSRPQRGTIGSSKVPLERDIFPFLISI